MTVSPRRHRHALAFGVMALGFMAGCGQEPAPAPPPIKYVQNEWAKNPGADCVALPPERYAAMTATPAGIEQLITHYCQYTVRGDFHRHEGTHGTGIDQRRDHLAMAITCMQEALAIGKAAQQAGITKFTCP